MYVWLCGYNCAYVYIYKHNPVVIVKSLSEASWESMSREAEAYRPLPCPGLWAWKERGGLHYLVRGRKCWKSPTRAPFQTSPSENPPSHGPSPKASKDHAYRVFNIQFIGLPHDFSPASFHQESLGSCFAWIKPGLINSAGFGLLRRWRDLISGMETFQRDGAWRSIGVGKGGVDTVLALWGKSGERVK